MPVIKSAKKKLRRDRKIEKTNKLFKNKFANALKEAKKSKTGEKIKIAVKLTDIAVKKNLIHKNKAARIKSSLSKLSGKTKITAKSVSKTSPKKIIKKQKK